MFIKLNGAGEVKMPLYVIATDIYMIGMGIDEDDESAVTGVHVRGNAGCILVQETPEQIMAMLTPKFIRLNGAGEVKKPLYILPHQIHILGVGIRDDGETKFTAVHIKGNEGCIPVQETPEQIVEMIEKCSSC